MSKVTERPHPSPFPTSLCRSAFLREHPLLVEHVVRVMAMLDGAWFREASLAAAADGLAEVEEASGLPPASLKSAWPNGQFEDELQDSGTHRGSPQSASKGPADATPTGGDEAAVFAVTNEVGPTVEASGNGQVGLTAESTGSLPGFEADAYMAGGTADPKAVAEEHTVSPSMKACMEATESGLEQESFLSAFFRPAACHLPARKQYAWTRT
eukprot:scaffold87451_cov30-Tisochrysis_lutea.AAC.4